MPLETFDQIQDLNPSWPTGTDPKSEGDNHIRGVKASVQASFPGMTAPWTTSSKITSAGLDASGAKVENVGAPALPTDAARLDEILGLDARVDALEQQAPAARSFGTFLYSAPGVPDLGGGSGDYTVTWIETGVVDLSFNEVASALYAQSVTANAIGQSPFIDDYSIVVQPVSTTVWRITSFLGNGNEADIPIAFMRLST